MSDLKHTVYDMPFKAGQMWAAVYRKDKDKIKLITNGLGKGTLPKERGKKVYVNYLGLKIQGKFS